MSYLIIHVNIIEISQHKPWKGSINGSTNANSNYKMQLLNYVILALYYIVTINYQSYHKYTIINYSIKKQDHGYFSKTPL